MTIQWKETIFSLLLLTTASVNANVFKLPKTSARFTLEINREKLSYRSERMREVIEVKKCNFELIKTFNNSFLKRAPALVAKGLDFQIDQVSMTLDPKNSYTLGLLNMDERMSTILMTEKQLCKR